MSRNFDQSKVKDKWGVCFSCQTNRYIVSRGLCMKCWKRPEVRERFKDKRIVARNPITPEQHDILTNDTLTEPKKLYFLAFRVAHRYGASVEIDDLVQVGWLMMVKHVKDYDPTWKTSLFRYCKRGISSDMERYARNEIRAATMGTSHDDFIDFIKNDAIARQSTLRGGMSRYHLGMTFNITKHALDRYRERINPTGNRKDLKKIVECSERMCYEREQVWLGREPGVYGINEVREYGGVVLLMGPSLHLWSKQQQVITVLNKDTAATTKNASVRTRRITRATEDERSVLSPNVPNKELLCPDR